MRCFPFLQAVPAHKSGPAAAREGSYPASILPGVKSVQKMLSTELVVVFRGRWLGGIAAVEKLLFLLLLGAIRLGFGIELFHSV